MKFFSAAGISCNPCNSNRGMVVSEDFAQFLLTNSEAWLIMPLLLCTVVRNIARTDKKRDVSGMEEEMLHPNYIELMKVVNKDVEEGEEPVISSRYSIVMATAKRARQLVEGAEPLIEASPKDKPLSIAVDELWHDKYQILGEADDDEDEEEARLLRSYTAGKVAAISEDDLNENLDADASGDEEDGESEDDGESTDREEDSDNDESPEDEDEAEN